jgi:hypothetical protein
VFHKTFFYYFPDQISRLERNVVQVKLQQNDIIDMLSTIMQMVQGHQSDNIINYEALEISGFQNQLPFRNGFEKFFGQRSQKKD